MLYIAEVTNHIGSSLLKISILLFYKRLTASGHSMRFFYAVRFAILFVTLWALAILVVLLSACTPLDAFWKSASVADPYTQKYTCLDESVYWPLNVSMSVLTDFITVLIPVWMVKGLDVSRRQKSMLYMVFGLGILFVYTPLPHLVSR